MLNYLSEALKTKVDDAKRKLQNELFDSQIKKAALKRASTVKDSKGRRSADAIELRFAKGHRRGSAALEFHSKLHRRLTLQNDKNSRILLQRQAQFKRTF